MSESKSASAPVLLDEAGEHPTLDELMRRDPAALSESDRECLAERLRQDRAVFIKSEAERKRR